VTQLPAEPHAPHAEEKTKETNIPMLIAMILLSVCLASVAQLTLKHGMNLVSESLRPHPFGLDGASLRAAAGTWAVWAGLFLFGLSALVWLIVLSRASLSFAYPFASLTYVLILLFDRFWLNENVPGLRWAGVALIAAGIILVSRTPHS
jgi:drug/metabolite transporter (DMT)-like permease